MEQNIGSLKNRVIVIKHGGSSMTDKGAMINLLNQVIDLNKSGAKVILVHGGGPEISSYMKKLDIQTRFIEGLRFTDIEALDIVKMVLAGKVNKELVSLINNGGGNAVGLSGIDGKLLVCSKKYIRQNGNLIDGGFIGEVQRVNTNLLDMLLSAGIIPVVAPVGTGINGEVFNINGDDAASSIASAMNADIFSLVSDIDGIYKDISDRESLIKEITANEAELLIEGGLVTGGMIPKVQCCIEAVKKGVKSVFIINGLVEGNLIRNLVNCDINGTVITN